MPKEQKEKQNLRQRPVSCKFCRARKLRCSRESPCANCVSRRITCELDQPVPQPVCTVDSSESEIIARLRRLEQLLVERTSGSGALLRENEEHVPKHVKAEPHCPHARELGDQIHGLAKDVSWLESVFVTDGFSVRIEWNGC
jgi:hypothetical protein